MTSCKLQIKGGQFLVLRNYPDAVDGLTLKLEIDDIQNQKNNVVISEAPGNNHHFSLYFKHGDDQYLLTVNGQNLHIEKDTDSNEDNKSNSLFQRENLGTNNYYRLKTVASSQYICVDKKYIILTDDISKSVPLTDES